MSQVICRYVGHDAGVLNAEQLSDGQTVYSFTPYHSRAHSELEHKLKAAGHAKVELEWQGKRVYMTAVAMEPQSITLLKP